MVLSRVRNAFFSMLVVCAFIHFTLYKASRDRALYLTSTKHHTVSDVRQRASMKEAKTHSVGGKDVDGTDHKTRMDGIEANGSLNENKDNKPVQHSFWNRTRGKKDKEISNANISNVFDSGKPAKQFLFAKKGKTGYRQTKETLPVIAWLNASPSRKERLKEYLRLGKCPFGKCTLKYVHVTEKQKFTWNENIQWNAIIFQGNRILLKVPPRRLPHQAFVFFNTEPPPYIHLLRYKSEKWNGVFNWTMTYRLDSDIPIPFGIIKKRDVPVVKDYREIFRLKTKMSAWIVSHCDTDGKRENYVDILKNFTNVDVYGQCGTLHNCSRKENNLCRESIDRDYKFYLGFENNFCKDYATEKIFRMFEKNLIVVVRGGANYSDFLPEGTYIDTSKFKTIRALGTYLNELGSNEEQYIGYLKRKDEYRSEFSFQRSYCDLCHRLHNVDKYRKSYTSMGDWWLNNTCLKPKEIKDLI